MKKLLSLSIATLLSLSVAGYAAAQEETTSQADQPQHQQHATKHHANKDSKKVTKENQDQRKNHTEKKAKQHNKEGKRQSDKTTKQHNSSAKHPAKQHHTAEEPSTANQAE